MARSPRQHSVGASAATVAKHSAARRKPIASGRTSASVAAMLSAPNPVSTTTPVAHNTRIARASVGKRARRRRQRPGAYSTSHQEPVKLITAGVRPIANSAHPACPIIKLTCSRRPAASSRAAYNSLLTAANLSLAALRAAALADGENEVALADGAAPWTPALDSASAPRRSRRQPPRPRSSRVGSRAMAMAAAKAINVRRLRSRWLYASVASSASKSSEKASEALPRAHRQESST
eukprot:scaffold27053_cov72-Phaeocystis_antarctica.AAC.2